MYEFVPTSTLVMLTDAALALAGTPWRPAMCKRTVCPAASGAPPVTSFSSDWGEAAVEHAHRRERLELVAAGAAEVAGQVDRDVDADVGLQADRAVRDRHDDRVGAHLPLAEVDRGDLVAGRRAAREHPDEAGELGGDRGQVECDRGGVTGRAGATPETRERTHLTRLQTGARCRECRTDAPA